MNKRILFGTVLALAALTIIAAPASARPSAEVSGSYSLSESTLEYIQWWPAGHNCKLECGFTYPFQGDLDGAATFHYSIMVHGPCTADAPPGQGVYYATLKAWGTFDGQVDGKSGTFDFTYEDREWPAEPGESALTARIVVLSGAGELANLHGVLDVTYVVGDDFDSYSGQIHFDKETGG